MKQAEIDKLVAGVHVTLSVNCGKCGKALKSSEYATHDCTRRKWWEFWR